MSNQFNNTQINFIENFAVAWYRWARLCHEYLSRLPWAACHKSDETFSTAFSASSRYPECVSGFREMSLSSVGKRSRFHRARPRSSIDHYSERALAHAILVPTWPCWVSDCRPLCMRAHTRALIYRRTDNTWRSIATQAKDTGAAGRTAPRRDGAFEESLPTFE